MLTPLEQFEMLVLMPIVCWGWDISVSNLVVSLLLNGGLIVYVLTNNVICTISGKVQVLVEEIYGLVVSIIMQQIGLIGLRYLPIIMYIFIIIWGINFMGMIPFSLTVTSHLIFTLSLGVSMCVGVFIIGILMKGKEFFRIFVPSNIPEVLVPFIVVIEVVSYLIRPISLSMRLFANIMAGHTLMFILGAFVVTLLELNIVFTLIALLLMLAIFMLEVGIAFLQAYVFIVLVSVYLNDSI